MPNLQITELEREDEAAWDAYVYDSAASTFYHQLRSVLIKLFKSLMWRNVVEKKYKHKPIYLVAKEEGEIKRVLPLFLMISVIFGKKLVSVPFVLIEMFAPIVKGQNQKIYISCNYKDTNKG